MSIWQGDEIYKRRQTVFQKRAECDTEFAEYFEEDFADFVADKNDEHSSD